MPELSFIVPVYNEAAVLAVTLLGLQRAGRACGRSFEIIVADDASTDASPRLAVQLGARVVRHERRQIAATRNLGAAAARGRYLIFVDADTIVPASAVRGALRGLDAGLVGGGGAFRFDGPRSLRTRCTEAVANLIYRCGRLATGCFIFCRRDVFKHTGGFDERQFAAEETVLAQALGKHGRVRALPLPTLTSGRKLRTHGHRELARVLVRGSLRGLAGFQQREGLELWYGERREDLASK
ncbi:MAG: glycosyltransferase [Planctomycetota bacterium]|jgi:glycosyltransferase involved in cell wall biosynthesis|nr:glycosyltransferase [Planctomycetota bacterium]